MRRSIRTTGLDPVAGGDDNTISGTSMAASHIAGIVAQLFQAEPTDGFTTSYDKGAGLVDVVAAGRVPA